MSNFDLFREKWANSRQNSKTKTTIKANALTGKPNNLKRLSSIINVVQQSTNAIKAASYDLYSRYRFFTFSSTE